MTERVAVIGILGLMLTACTTATPVQLSALEVALRWGTPARPADPLAVISMGAIAAPFLIDTGTSELLLTANFAETAGLHKSEQGLRREQLVYGIADQTFSVDRYLVIDAPPLQAEGWGGIYSPQLLTANAMVILDFPRLKLVMIATTPTWTATDSCRTAANAYMASQHPGTALHRLAWRGRTYGAVLVKGGLLGKPSILLDVDTGKAVSAFRPSYIGPGSESGPPGPRMVDLRGVEETTRLVQGQTVQLGDLSLTNRTIAAHDTGGKLPDGSAWDGNLGIDLLKDAIVVLCPVGTDVLYIGVKKPS